MVFGLREDLEDADIDDSDDDRNVGTEGRYPRLFILR